MTDRITGLRMSDVEYLEALDDERRRARYVGSRGTPAPQRPQPVKVTKHLTCPECGEARVNAVEPSGEWVCCADGCMASGRGAEVWIKPAPGLPIVSNEEYWRQRALRAEEILNAVGRTEQGRRDIRAAVDPCRAARLATLFVCGVVTALFWWAVWR